jgi:exoribonuclease-2
MASHPHAPSPGTIVEYLQDNQPVIGSVLEDASRQLRVLNINKRLVKLPAARILPWAGPSLSTSLSRQEVLEALQEHHLKRERLQDHLDPMEIWELAQEEAIDAEVDWFAGLLWQDPDVDHLAALGRALLRCKTHFKFQPPRFIVFDRDKVEAKQAAQEAERKRRELLNEGQPLLKALWDMHKQGHPLELPAVSPETEEALTGLLKQGVTDPENQAFLDQWKDLRRGLPDDPHLPLILSQAWGLLPRHHNHHLDQAGYDWGDDWAEGHQEEIDRLKEEVSQSRSEPEDLRLISIDSPSTRDIDDAFALRPAPGGGVQLTLALACPALGWAFGSDLDRAVAHRASSVYLPEGTAHMLPEALGTDLFSLIQDQDRPALLLDITLDPDGQVRETGIRFGWVRLQQNMSYEKVEELLEAGHDEHSLRTALDLATGLRERRIEAGAVILEQNDPSITLEPEADDVRIHLAPPKTHPKAQLVVSEFMILANSVVADWAQSQSIPLIHRTQNIALPPRNAGVWEDPVDIFRIFRDMSSSRLDVTPKAHASLGLKRYAPVTSPLRRYVDFLNLAQLTSVARTSQPRFSEDQLEAMLPHLSARSQAVSQIQRSRLRYWKLLYLKRYSKIVNWHGIVVADNGNVVTLSLPREQIFVRGERKIFGDKITPGQRYQLRLGRIDPLNNEIHVINAWEE